MTVELTTCKDTLKELELPKNNLVSVKPSKIISCELGVEAINTIEVGQIIFKITGPVIQEATKYTFQVTKDKHLDPQDEEDRSGFGHFTNHSCNPSAFIRIIRHNGDGEIDVIARRRIAPGEEVTVDYAAMEYDPVARGVECKCGSDNCRGIITGYKDLANEVKKLYISQGIVSSYLLKMDDRNGKIQG